MLRCSGSSDVVLERLEILYDNSPGPLKPTVVSSGSSGLRYVRSPKSPAASAAVSFSLLTSQSSPQQEPPGGSIFHLAAMSPATLLVTSGSPFYLQATIVILPYENTCNCLARHSGSMGTFWRLTVTHCVVINMVHLQIFSGLLRFYNIFHSHCITHFLPTVTKISGKRSFWI